MASPALFPSAIAAVSLLVPRMAGAETKTGSTASYIGRLLLRSRCRPGRVATYATGLAALHSEHSDPPTGPWRRTPRRGLPPHIR